MNFPPERIDQFGFALKMFHCSQIHDSTKKTISGEGLGFSGQDVRKSRFWTTCDAVKLGSRWLESKTCDAGVWDAITYLDFINISESAPDTFLWPKKYPKMPRVWVQRTESGAD
ncbi:hypothetical protein [Vibrio rhizosphaerae]|uniref:hypothetical protein n=1 Tax=Vibrio rhizosphaerae TaxID=398736 RepID=UPI000570810D|nr:hypothetical protein [Vibrio rhizosphaerae]